MIPRTPSTFPGLTVLEATVRRDLSLLGYPRREWVPPRLWQGKEVLDVLIVGAGQSGLSAAFALKRENVNRLLVVDQKPAGKEGPWKDFARMTTLRTPKHVTGPDLGIPSLTFQSWYESQYGAEAWTLLKLIPKEQWADYLFWYRTVLELPVRNGVQVGALDWNAAAKCWDVPVVSGEKREVLRARKVVLATGIDGSGRWETPAIIQSLPKKFWAHTREQIDFTALVGKAVGVLGAGASAFDNASVALESGAEKVDLFFRREKMVDVNPYRWAEFTGFLKHHSDLPDAWRWKFISRFVKMGQLPPADTLARARRHDGFGLHPGSPWTAVEVEGDQVRVTTPKGSFLFDYLILGTGFITDLGIRPELSGLKDTIATWADRYTPPAEEAFEDLGRHPYLGPSGQFLPKVEGKTPWISSLFCYTFAGLPSLGFAGAFISGLKYSLPKLVDGITGQLYEDEAAHFLATLEAYDAKEF
jgi:cation diffusion facilitator CzcD-associated flavoprotein CzcO